MAGSIVFEWAAVDEHSVGILINDSFHRLVVSLDWWLVIFHAVQLLQEVML